MDETFINSIDKYYSLKNQYEEDFYRLKKAIIKNENLNWKEKRIQFQKLKPKCINCKRPVGSIFKTLYDDESLTRKITAICGDNTNPCPLHIEIDMGETINLPESIDKENIELNKNNNNIIKFKNDEIFGFIDSENIVELFENVINNINETNYLLNYYNDILYNIENKNIDRIKILTIGLFNTINENKFLLEKYFINKDKTILNTIVSNYVNDIFPKNNELRKLKYSINEVENNNGIYTLIQEKNKINDLEIHLNMNIIHFNIGMKKENKTKKITRNKNKNITRKNKGLVIEE